MNKQPTEFLSTIGVKLNNIQSELANTALVMCTGNVENRFPKIEQVIRLHQKGLPNWKIAQEVGVEDYAISGVLQLLGLKPNRKNVKKTDEIRRKILALVDGKRITDEFVDRISKEVGMPAASVMKVIEDGVACSV